MELAVVARILALGLGRRFPLFLTFLLADLVGAAIAAPFGVHDHQYRSIWLVRQPVAIVLGALAAWETIVRLSEGYPAFSRKRRGVAMLAAALGVVIGLWMAWPVKYPKGAMGWTYIAVGFEAVAVSVAMLAANLLFSLAPASARANSITHARLFAMLTMVNVVGIFAMTRAPRTTQTVFSVVTLGCYLGWVALMSRRGDVLSLLPAMTAEQERADLMQHAEDDRMLAAIRDNLRSK